MFTGIVRERGRVVSAESNGGGGTLRLRIAAPRTAAQTGLGDSVSIAGCCLTAVAVGSGQLAFDAVPETLARTTLDGLAEGAEVNLEPALRAGEPLGGHYVQGHVDGVGRVRTLEREGEGARLRLDVPEDVLRYCVEKGSVAVDGVSLTVADVDEGGVGIALVPHTLRETTLSHLEPGDRVNLEADVLAKYVERLARR
ncbi:MAG TPA: riboflavin synthase [Gaiellaceae bacterium]|nr:riboflavin synthase [Gaiellaceae bacterium]